MISNRKRAAEVRLRLLQVHPDAEMKSFGNCVESQYRRYKKVLATPRFHGLVDGRMCRVWRPLGIEMQSILRLEWDDGGKPSFVYDPGRGVLKGMLISAGVSIGTSLRG